MSHSFELPHLQHSINTCLESLQSFLLNRTEPALQQLATALQTRRQELCSRSVLSLSFSGQYSAGKSTIISALTGITNIKISADVATDQVKPYSWQGIELWDTPGLYANRPDHDEKAKQALREADLVVYCLTTNLFDDITARDFRWLAFERGYAGKLFLVINKLSMEDAEDTDRYIDNLTTSINRTLTPHKLNDFTHAFIDAQDYRDGITTNNTELITFSRFNAFVAGLNSWVKQRGLLARLDPAIRLGLNIIEEALATLPEQSFTDNPDLFLVNQQLRIVQSQRRRTDGEVKRIGNTIVQKVQLLGEQLLGGSLGTDQSSAEAAFQRACEDINKEAFDTLNNTLQSSYQQLVTKLEEFANEPYVADYYAAVDAAAVASKPPGSGRGSGGRNPLKDLAKNLLDKGRESMLKDGASHQGFFYGAKEVAGGGVHQLIYKGGKFFGKKFKPYEAVRMAKGVGDAMAVLGVVLAAYEVYEAINENIQEDQREKQRKIELREFRNDIAKLGNDMAAEVHKIYQEEFDLPVIGDIYSRINAVRDEILARQSANKSLVQELATYRGQLNQLLSLLYAQGRGDI